MNILHINVSTGKDHIYTYALLFLFNHFPVTKYAIRLFINTVQLDHTSYTNINTTVSMQVHTFPSYSIHRLIHTNPSTKDAYTIHTFL